MNTVKPSFASQGGTIKKTAPRPAPNPTTKPPGGGGIRTSDPAQKHALFERKFKVMG